MRWFIIIFLLLLLISLGCGEGGSNGNGSGTPANDNTAHPAQEGGVVWNILALGILYLILRVGFGSTRAESVKR